MTLQMSDIDPNRDRRPQIMEQAGGLLGNLIGRQQIWIMLAVISAYLFITEPTFRSIFNVCNILLDCSYIAFLAIGLTPLIISRNIDLAVGSILALSACLVVGLADTLGAMPAIAIALLAGMSVGLLNGLIVEILKLDSFIVTLAAMIGIRGLAFLFAGQDSLSTFNDSLMSLGLMSFGALSVIPIVVIVLAVTTQWALRRTVAGRNIHAIGGNRSAAVNAGIRIERYVIGAFIFSGLMASLAGVAMAANLSAANANFGQSYELWAIAAVVLGGTRLTGGSGSAINSFAAALMLSVLRNGMNLKHVESFYVLVTMGLALILALLIDKYLTYRRLKKSGG